MVEKLSPLPDPNEEKPETEIVYAFHKQFPVIGHHLDITSKLGESWIHFTCKPDATPKDIADNLASLRKFIKEEGDDPKEVKEVILNHLQKLEQQFRSQIEE